MADDCRRPRGQHRSPPSPGGRVGICSAGGEVDSHVQCNGTASLIRTSSIDPRATAPERRGRGLEAAGSQSMECLHPSEALRTGPRIPC